MFWAKTAAAGIAAGMLAAWAAAAGAASAAPAALPTGAHELVAIGAIEVDGVVQAGFADLRSVERTGSKAVIWDLWANGRPYAMGRPDGAAVSWVWRRYVLDCDARTDMMTDVAAFDDAGAPVDRIAVPDPRPLPVEYAGETELELVCKGVEPEYGVRASSVEEAVALTRRLAAEADARGAKDGK
jgi:hypothetical protein